ncbi:homeobox protein CDX-1-like [Scleropages formosus]|uniref:Homeobox protein CDX-1-like n=1 Tax=Scleropages formosus TaxID=113540 RepID=A0A8C9RNE2_SCLFO|nr:homeobox protein CDX-1-like [Scleropages formosus]
MYVGYVLDKEGTMYHQGTVRRSSINMPPQNFISAPQYSDYAGYHHVPNMECHSQATGTWGPPYGGQREDWGAYGLAPQAPLPGPANNLPPGQGSFASQDYTAMNPPPGSTGLQPAPQSVPVSEESPETERRSNSYQWMRKTAQSTSTGKTRTKDKYRVVYTDHQRLELEKEFHYNRYITIRRKSELALNLGLSERQVKIWFQNRRAKERKLIKRKMAQSDGSGSSGHSEPGSLSPLPPRVSMSPSEIHINVYPPMGIDNLQPVRNMQQVTVTQ